MPKSDFTDEIKYFYKLNSTLTKGGSSPNHLTNKPNTPNFTNPIN